MKTRRQMKRQRARNAKRLTPALLYVAATRIGNGKRRISAESAVKIEKATGVPRSRLRPDLFGEAA